MGKITSEAFGQGDAIPRKYTGDGHDVSPPLRWEGFPAGTKELAMIVEDPDAPQAGPFVHWVVYKIAPDVTGLAEAVAAAESLNAPAGALQGRNSFGKIGYGGPAPPKGHGTHHYHFRLYALDQPLQVRAGLDGKALRSAMSGHVLDQGDLVGTYQR